MFLSGGLSSIPVWVEGIEGKEKKKTYKCVYLFEDGLSVFKSHRGERKKEGREKKRQKEKVIQLVVTRGGISCREIAVYCFCDRGNVNWPCGCVTSQRGRKGD